MHQTCLLLCLIGWLTCCTESDPYPVQLEKRDLALTKSLDSLLYHRDEMPDDSFRLGMQELRRWELILFYDARHCDFGKDVTRGYYWQLGRLKYPSQIQQKMEQLHIDPPPIPAK